MNVLIILLILLWLFYNDSKKNVDNKEGYSNELFDKIKLSMNNSLSTQLNTGNISEDCYSLTPDKCMDFQNCGLCLIKGKSPQCVPGDVEGPYFKDSCDRWAYTNYNDRQMFSEKVTTVTAPWNFPYPDYDTWYPTTARATLF